MKYLTILADPPWEQPMTGKYLRRRHKRAQTLPYPSMELEQICALDVEALAADGCHLWLWTTNSFLEAGFRVMQEWGFKYLAPIHWVKPSGLGNYVIHRTQTLLLGYYKRCEFPALRYFENVVEALPRHHSYKPDAFYGLIEQVSGEPRLELFAREKRFGWDVFGDEVYSDVELTTEERQ